MAKIGIENVNSTLATAIRTVEYGSWPGGWSFSRARRGGISQITARSWVFLILSSLATGASWLCYYALQQGEASKVIPLDKLSVVISLVLAFLVLHEKVDVKAIIGGVLITAGTLVMVL